MARKKCKCPDGVPEWIVTYGDMMSLLLCFFILLAAFSELKRDDAVVEVIKAIKEAFGVTPDGSGVAPTVDMPMQSVMERVLETALYREKIRKLSQADDPGVVGRELTVKRIREGLQFTVGGLLTFEPGSAELKPQAREELIRVANLIRGQNNKVELRGHASGMDLPSGTQFRTAWDLSYARARAVMEFLTDPAQGIDPRRIRITGCGDKEPLVARVYEDALLAVNRRAEVIVTESLMQEFDAAKQQEMISLADNQ